MPPCRWHPLRLVHGPARVPDVRLDKCQLPDLPDRDGRPVQGVALEVKVVLQGQLGLGGADDVGVLLLDEVGKLQPPGGREAGVVQSEHFKVRFPLLSYCFDSACAI